MNYNNKRLIGAMIVAGWDEADGGQVGGPTCLKFNTPEEGVPRRSHMSISCSSCSSLAPRCRQPAFFGQNRIR